MSKDSGLCVVGVDGGNTKTVAIATDLHGRFLGWGGAGSSNWEIQGERDAGRAILDAIRGALGDRRELSDVRHVHLGLAGLDWPEDETLMRGVLTPLLGHVPITMENDGFLAVRASTIEGVGITVSSGTGVTASLIEADGPGFFYGYSAELGGGIDIDLRTIQAVVRAIDGRGTPTSILNPLLAATGHSTVHELLYAITRKGYVVPHQVGRRILFGACREGDGVAVNIVTAFAKELALLATNLIRKSRPSPSAIRVVASGALFNKTGPLMFSVFKDEVLRVSPAAEVILCRVAPAVGAVRIALENVGVDTRQIWCSEINGNLINRLPTDDV